MDGEMQVAFGLACRQAQDHITLLAEKPVADNVAGPPARLAFFQANHQPQFVLDKVQREGPEGQLAAEAITLQSLEPRPQPVLQRVAGFQQNLSLHHRAAVISSTALSNSRASAAVRFAA